MGLLFDAAAAVAALLHVLFFLLESAWWMKPAVHRRVFGLPTATAEAARLLAFNQGFYNLFLAAGVAARFLGPAFGLAREGLAVATFALLSMLAAAAVLLFSKPSAWQGALVQGAPPAAALAAMLAG